MRFLVLVFIAIALLVDTATAQSASTNWLRLDSCDISGARPREVKSVYSDLHRHTEVCIVFAPKSQSSEPSPLRITFSFTHVGREIKTPPAVVLLHVSLPSHFTPQVPSLQLVLDGTEQLDLTGAGQPYSVTFPPNCAMDCSYTGVVVPLPLHTFSRIGTARAISGEAFGVGFSLTAEDWESLTPFIARLVPHQP